MEHVTQDSSFFYSIPLDALLLNQPLPFPIYLKILNNFVLFRQRGDVLTENRINKLSEKIEIVFIPHGDWEPYLDLLEDEVFDEADTDLEHKVTYLRNLIVSYQQLIERKKILQKEQIQKFQKLGYRLSDAIKSNPAWGSKLLRRFHEPALYYVNHSVNVGIYCAAVAHKLGMDTRHVRELTFSALVHNVGNLFIPKEILYKSSTLNKAEWDLVKEHPFKGAKILENLQVPNEVIITALQHHERVDGLGYPSQLTGKEIHPFAKICTIADVYDALTTQGPYQGALSPIEAVGKMKTMLGKFEPQILKIMAA